LTDSIRELFPEMDFLHHDIDEVYDPGRQLEFRLNNRRDEMATVRFPRYLQYTRVDETWGAETCSYIYKELKMRPHWLFELTKSPLLNDLRSRYGDWFEARDPRHFTMLTNDDVVDVIASAGDQPTVSLDRFERKGTMIYGHDREIFKDMRVVLDNGYFENCMFEGCELVYGSGETAFNKNLVNECRFSFDEGAARTVNFLKGLYKDAPEIVEATIREIRNG
jgi:hypothetical protein